MRIVFTSNGKGWDSKIDSRFGRTEYLLLLDGDKLTSYDNRQIGDVAHGAGPKTAQKLFDLAPDILITGNGPGGNALNILSGLNMKIFIGAGGLTVREAFEKFEDNQLQQQ